MGNRCKNIWFTKNKKVLVTYLIVTLVLLLLINILHFNSLSYLPFMGQTSLRKSLFKTMLSGADSQLNGSLIDNSIFKGICCGKEVQKRLGEDGSWQPIDQALKMYAISAYYIKSEKKVFIIGAKPMHKVAVICQLWTKQNDNDVMKIWETDAIVGTPNDPAGPLPYTAVTFECDLNGHETDLPMFVSLVTHTCEKARNFLQIKNASKVDTYERRFTVCLAPLFSYKSAQNFIEWVELNRILGVDKIIVYDHSISADVKQILKYYSERNLTELIPWRLPFHVQHHIHYFGQTVALNDCLFRTKQISEFMTNIDLDEYIIPHSTNASNWDHILKAVDQSADGFIFQNTFFRKEWTNEKIEFKEKMKAKELQLVTLMHFEHEKKIYRHMDRSKYFVRPSRVHYTLIHEIPKARIEKIPPEKGLLHHYRNWENYADKQERVKDTTVLEKFKEILIKNVEIVWKDLDFKSILKF